MDSPPILPVATHDLREHSLTTEISQRARQLWLSYGRPIGRDLPIWLEAERQVLGADPKVASFSGGAVPAPPLADVFRPTMHSAPTQEMPPDAVRS